MQEATIFNKVNQRPEFGFAGADIARMSGLDKSLISRFLNGRTDISLSKFFRLIRSMPSEFQCAFWKEFHVLADPAQFADAGDRIPWTELITQATYDDLEEILKAMTERWTELRGKEKASQLAGVG